MKTLLDRADAALKIRLAKIRRGGTEAVGKGNGKVETGMEGLAEEMENAKIAAEVGSLPSGGYKSGVAAAGGNGGDEWEVLQHEGGMPSDEETVAIRVDQYLVVFLKFMASVTPGIEHDFTMGV